MDEAEDSAFARDVAGMIAWWRDAGVDLTFDDEPAQWISPAQPTALAAERLRAELREAVPLDANVSSPGTSTPGLSGLRPSAAASISREDAVDLSALPADFAQFASWWLAEPSLDGGRTAARVPPRGPQGAALMMLVPEPEAEDDERLLSGSQGRLLAAIVAALGLREDEVYVASALPRHMPMPDWSELAERGYGQVLVRHVTLAAPRRLVAFGGGVLSLLGNSLPNNPAVPRIFSHDGMQLPAFAARSFDALLARPVWKAELWNGLLDWLPSEPGSPAKSGLEDSGLEDSRFEQEV